MIHSVSQGTWHTKKLKFQKSCEHFGKHSCNFWALHTRVFISTHKYFLGVRMSQGSTSFSDQQLLRSLQQLIQFYCISFPNSTLGLISTPYLPISQNGCINYFHQQQKDVQCIHVHLQIAGNCRKELEKDILLFPVCNPRVNMCNYAYDVSVTH